jgi:hypothetical protein
LTEGSASDQACRTGCAGVTGGARVGSPSEAKIARRGVLRVLRVADLLHEKLRAGRDPARRRSKRLQDLADAQGLLEQDPALRGELSADERALLDNLPG